MYVNLVFRRGVWVEDVHLETISKSVVFTIMGLEKLSYRESVDREKARRQILGHPST